MTDKKYSKTYNFVSETNPLINYIIARNRELNYHNIIKHIYLHVAALYGVYLCVVSCCWPTIIFSYFTYVCAIIGVTAGAHRLWAHRSYKAKTPLQILLVIFLSMANQNAIDWVKDHRLHHKYTDTDADPNNIKRGLFFSHMGFMYVKKHPEVEKKEKTINMEDLYNNPIVMLQYNYRLVLSLVFCYILPALIPIIFWNESYSNAWHSVIVRHTLNLHAFYLVNSAAHYYGYKTYNNNISATEHKAVSIATFGEGFHNYHHVFPSDYRNAEFGNEFFNYSKCFIDLFALLGWAHDLKVVRKDVVLKRIAKNCDNHKCN